MMEPLAGAGTVALLGSSFSMLGYLDPGAGSVLLQVLIAGLLGVGWAVKTWWYAIKSFVFRRGDTQKLSGTSANSAAEPSVATLEKAA